MITVKRKIGGAVLELSFDERNEYEALAKAIVFTEPDYCPNCKTANKIIWRSRKVKSEKDQQTYTYVERKCLNCGATSTLSQYVTGGYFWKKFEVYQPQQQAQQPYQPQQPVQQYHYQQPAQDNNVQIPPATPEMYQQASGQEEIRVEDIPF